MMRDIRTRKEASMGGAKDEKTGDKDKKGGGKGGEKRIRRERKGRGWGEGRGLSLGRECKNDLLIITEYFIVKYFFLHYVLTRYHA